MKSPTNRARKNANEKTIQPQAQRAALYARRPDDPTQGATGTNWKGAFIALSLDDGDGGGCSDDIVDLSRKEFLALQAGGKSDGTSAVMFAVKSALEKIGRINLKCRARIDQGARSRPRRGRMVGEKQISS
jgi:hypothetical protein